MPVKRQPSHPRREIPEIAPAGGTGSLDAARPTAFGGVRRFLKVMLADIDRLSACPVRGQR